MSVQVTFQLVGSKLKTRLDEKEDTYTPTLIFEDSTTNNYIVLREAFENFTDDNIFEDLLEKDGNDLLLSLHLAK